jgi:predicted dehydrogenase
VLGSDDKELTTCIGVGVIGVGFVGASHVEAARRTGVAQVVAVAGSSEQSARAAANRIHVADVAASWRELVADPRVEVVHNCTPNHVHAEIATAVLEARKHLITEKPLAVSSAQSRGLVELGDRAGVVAAVCQNYRHYAMTAQARALVAAGEIGDVHSVHGSYLQDWLLDEAAEGWRLDPELGGPSVAFADIGTHWCDLVSYVLGDRVSRVAARTGALGGRSADNHASVLLEFESGVLGSLVASNVSAGHKNRLRFQVDGSRGSIAWDQERPDELWIGRSATASEDIRKSPAALAPTAAPLAHFPQGHTEGWNTSFKNLFLSVYRTARGDPQPGDDAFATLADGHQRVCLIEAVVESARTREWVDLAA